MGKKEGHVVSLKENTRIHWNIPSKVAIHWRVPLKLPLLEVQRPLDKPQKQRSTPEVGGDKPLDPTLICTTIEGPSSLPRWFLALLTLYLQYSEGTRCGRAWPTFGPCPKIQIGSIGQPQNTTC